MEISNFLESEFNNCPFTISLSILDNLDKPFSDKSTIFIKDIREECYNNYHLEITSSNKDLYSVYVKVTRPLEADKKITLRHIINTMINSDYYGDEIVINHSHHNLIDFSQISESVYIANFNK